MVVAGFIIGSLGLVVATLSAGWQVFAWVMDGRRVRLTLVHGVLGRGGAATGTVGRDGRPLDLTRVLGGGFDGEEVIGVSVTNVGRAPVRVDKYGVELVRGGMAYHPIGDSIGPALPYRLPAGETETWYARRTDAQALIEATKSIRSGVGQGVRVLVQLGTGDTRRTRRTVKLGN